MLIDLVRRGYVDFSVFADIQYNPNDKHGFNVYSNSIFKMT